MLGPMLRPPGTLALLLMSCTRVGLTPAPPSAPPPPAAAATPAQPAPTSTADAAEPEGTPEQRAWDADNLERMLGYWGDLACLQARVRTTGEAARGAQPGSPPEEAWYQFKLAHAREADAWQQRLFASETRVLERSHMIGWLIDAHELVTDSYPRAYNGGGDAAAISESDARWAAIERRMQRHVEALGGAWTARACPDPSTRLAAAGRNLARTTDGEARLHR